MPQKTFAVSGQHYLFDVLPFAQTILSLGGDDFSYALRDRTTQGVIDDVISGVSELGVVVETSDTRAELEAAFDEAGVEFHELTMSRPRVALPASHPLVNFKQLTLEELAGYPYLYFEQAPGSPVAFYEEALSDVPREKKIACTDRATLTEMIMAMNGYTVTSGILVGITDGSALTTIPLETDVTLHLGYLTKKDDELGPTAQKFIDHLAKILKRYVD